MGGGYFKEVCFYHLGPSLMAIESSYHDGLNCRISLPGEAELATFDRWPILWELTGMTALFPGEEEIARDPGAIAAHLDLFPTAHDEFLRFIGAKLRGLFAGE